VTEEFHPGFRNSTASYTVSLLDPGVIADLRLAEHGLRIVERPMQNFLPLATAAIRSAPARRSPTRSPRRAASASRDAARLPDYYAMLGLAPCLLRSLLLAHAADRPAPPARPLGDAVVRPRSSARCRSRRSARCTSCSRAAPASCSTTGSRASR
jgi:phytoene dehydrogenase-like protein